MAHALMRVLLVGFGPFPGVPRNPSAFWPSGWQTGDAGASSHHSKHAYFATAYAAIDSELPKLLDSDPDIVLMFGLAARRRQLCIETHARNARSILFPDVSGYRPPRGVIALGEPAALRGSAPFAHLWRRRKEAECRHACHATPAAMSATTPIGARWRQPIIEAVHWSSSFTFRVFDYVSSQAKAKIPRAADWYRACGGRKCAHRTHCGAPPTKALN